LQVADGSVRRVLVCQFSPAEANALSFVIESGQNGVLWEKKLPQWLYSGATFQLFIKHYKVDETLR
jgi:hypothetical protein